MSLACILVTRVPVSLRPPFTAYNQKELAEKIREGKFRRIPYRYSEELNSLVCRMLHLKVLARRTTRTKHPLYHLLGLRNTGTAFVRI